MKVKVLSALLLLTFLWAVFVSYKYWQIKNNPRVVAITMDAAKGVLQNSQVGEMEKLTFLRQFLDRYYNYDSNNFWQSQTSLTSLMIGSLADNRVREVSRLREKIQQKNLSHLSRIVTLQQQKDGSYKATTHLQITEAAAKNDEATKSQLYITTSLKLQNTERTLENPWGLLVSEMKIENSATQNLALSPRIQVSIGAPTVLLFPCAIENIENPFEKNLNMKVTTLNVSELQLTPQKGLPEQASFTATCRDEEYKFELRAGGEVQDLYVSVPKELGVLRKKDSGLSRPRKKDVYDKTIENVLGIQLEN
ncbi:hypothetical protein ACLWBD_05425 [Bdellovibrio sp. HCB117]|uniref:hypothetical protein n=1 Tax=Bdellovibrio sp. HCB117 TaxID=3394359 RepID=UPI0039B6E3CD